MTDFDLKEIIDYIKGLEKHVKSVAKHPEAWNELDIAVDGVPESLSGVFSQLIVAVTLVPCGAPHVVAVLRTSKEDHPSCNDVLDKVLGQVHKYKYKLRWVIADSVERKFLMGLAGTNHEFGCDRCLIRVSTTFSSG